MRVGKIKVDSSRRLGDLMRDIGTGVLRIPRFQREFVWGRTRIQDLLDSMCKEYPIGTIFLWKTPPEFNHLLRDVEDLGQPPVEENQSYSLILDGQQRLTSLYAVVKGLMFDGEDYSKVVLDLNPETNRARFRYRQPDNKRWVSIHTLLSENVFEIYNRLPNDVYKEEFAQYRELLTTYPFSIVIVENVDINDAIEIFERINQQGRRLSRYDLITASVWTKDFDLRERTAEDIVDKLSGKFGEIAETSIPGSVFRFSQK